ncbi:DNA polymerase III subunit beta [Methylolobus aquaticus]
MKFAITRERLLRPLKAAAPVARPTSTLPILSHVLLKLDDDTLTITASDIESQIECRQRVDGGDPGALGEVCVPHAKLFQIARLADPERVITLEQEAGRMIVRYGRSRFQLQTLPATNFPAFDADDLVHRIDIEAEQLLRALSAVAHAQGIKDVRYYLNGTLLRAEGDRLTVVASDGHRVARYIVSDCATPCSEVDGVLDAILSRDAAGDIVKLLRDATGPVTLSLGHRSVTLTAGGDSFSSRTIEGRYADYERVLPKSYVTECTAGRAALLAALQRVAALTADSGAVKIISADGGLSLSSANKENETGEDFAEAEIDGAPLLAGFNVDYLIQTISEVTGDTARLEFTEHPGSCVVTDPANDAFLAMISPMRL